MQMKSDGWARIEVTDDDAPINTVLSLADVDLVGTAAGVFTVARNKVKSVMDDVPIVSLQKLGRRIFALSADGVVWERKGRD
jgi:hypothetical protein